MALVMKPFYLSTNFDSYFKFLCSSTQRKPPYLCFSGYFTTRITIPLPIGKWYVVWLFSYPYFTAIFYSFILRYIIWYILKCKDATQFSKLNHIIFLWCSIFFIYLLIYFIFFFLHTNTVFLACKFLIKYHRSKKKKMVRVDADQKL